MEGTFKSRLDQVFGALGSSQSTGWSVSEAQLDRRQWRPAEGADNSDDEEEPDHQVSLAPQSSSHGEQANNPKRLRRENADIDEDEEVEGMVGMDTTLDSEDEEDEYDKVAVGREGCGDRVYTDDLKGDNSKHLRSFREAGVRDNRALHQGAVERLAEDAREAQVSGSADFFKRFSGALNEKRKHGGGGTGDDKRRVRFQVEESEKAPNKAVARPSKNNSDRYKNVPDHVLHPEKYTCYSLDWSEDDRSKGNNVSAWRETMDLVGGSSKPENFELPEHITFVPRSREKKMEINSRASPAPAISISASEMEEDDKPGQLKSKFSPAKSYRSRVKAQEED